MSSTLFGPVRTERGFSSIIGVNPFVIALLWLRYGVELLKEGVGILEVLSLRPTARLIPLLSVTFLLGLASELVTSFFGEL